VRDIEAADGPWIVDEEVQEASVPQQLYGRRKVVVEPLREAPEVVRDLVEL
jgi:hypothetical protein